MEIRQFIFKPNDCSVIEITERKVTLFVDADVPVEVLEKWYRRICERERRWLAYRRRLKRQEGRRVRHRACQKCRRSKIRRYRHVAVRYRFSLRIR